MAIPKTGRTPGGLYFRVTGTGRPLVLLHGLLSSGDVYDDVTPLFEERYQVVVPDLRGHGRSGDMSGPYDVTGLAEDLPDLLDVLGVESAVILGQSHGGPVAQQVARTCPDRVDALVLVCTYAHNTATWRERAEGMLLTGLVATIGPSGVARLIVREGKSPGGGPDGSAEHAAWLRGVMAANSRRPMLGAVRGMRTFDSRPWLSSISAPALVVAGADDKAVPEHHLETLQAGLRSAETRVVPGAGHSLIWTHEKELALLVDDWLATL